MKHNLVCRLLIKATTILILVFSLSPTSGSAPAQQSQNKEVPLNELLKLPGKLLAQGTNQAMGNPKVAGYRIEELQLRSSINVEIRGQQVSVDRAWRISLSGGPFPVRSLPAVIWIDDQIAAYGIENETLSRITAITFDGSLIREGAVVSLSYGEDKDSRLKISQRLHLKNEGGNQ